MAMLSTSSGTLAKKDVPALIKAVKTHIKNAALCREGLLAIQAKLLDKDGGKLAKKQFCLNKTGGISTVLATMHHHVNDVTFIEAAVAFLWTLTQNTGLRKARTYSKLAKKGGSKILLQVVNAHPTQPKILVSVLTVVVPLAAIDRKCHTLARMNGALVTLITIVKTPNLPKDLLVSTLSALNALSKNDQNITQLGKRGAIPTLVDICENKSRSSPLALKYALKVICNMCKSDKHVSAFVKEGCVMTTIILLEEVKDCIEVQKIALDVLKCLNSKEEGREHFRNAGGLPRIVGIIAESHAGTKEEQLLDIVLHLFKFHGLCDLPITHEEEVTWSLPEEFEKRRTGDVEDLDVEDDEYCNANQYEEMDAQTLTDLLRQFSPELVGVMPGSLQGVPLNLSVAAATAQQTQHVRLFTAPRPSPSCASSLEYVPESIEALYEPVPNLRTNLIKHMLRRLTHPQEVINEVVYDDIPRSNGNIHSSADPALDPTFPSSSNPKQYATPPLRFSSHFESGNLKRAIRMYDTEYDLILNTDVNCAVHAQWFYWSVENAVPGVTYKFNIINMEKSHSQFNEGQRPLMFSEKEFTSRGIGWSRVGFDIAYMRNPYTRRIRRGGYGDATTYFTLHFSVEFKHPFDRAYLSYCYPYTYTDLQNYLRNLPETHPNLSDYFINQVFCQTLDSNNCNLLTITTLDGSSPVAIHDRRLCIISGRVHPGETCASWMVKGLIDFLIDSNNEQSKYMRDNFVWKIVPMLNPDGVVNGNHRCSLTGRDLNREWTRPNKYLYPEIWHLKHYIRYAKEIEGRTVLMYGDFHGHSLRKNIFIYGCSAHPKKKADGGSQTFERVFPKLLSDVAPFFSFETCSFKITKGHQGTGRVVAWRQLGVRLSYTIEASMCGSNRVEIQKASDDSDDQSDEAQRGTSGHFSTRHYTSMGMYFVKTVRTLCALQTLEGSTETADLPNGSANDNGYGDIMSGGDDDDEDGPPSMPEDTIPKKRTVKTTKKALPSASVGKRLASSSSTKEHISKDNRKNSGKASAGVRASNVSSAPARAQTRRGSNSRLHSIPEPSMRKRTSNSAASNSSSAAATTSKGSSDKVRTASLPLCQPLYEDNVFEEVDDDDDDDDDEDDDDDDDDDSNDSRDEDYVDVFD